MGSHVRGDRPDRRCAHRERLIADLGLDLQHGAGKRRANPGFFELRLGEFVGPLTNQTLKAAAVAASYSPKTAPRNILDRNPRILQEIEQGQR